MLGMGKKPETKTRLAVLPSSFNDMDADYFPVSENAENKPDLPKVGGGSDLMGKKEKAGSGVVRTGRMILFWWGSKIFRRGGLE